MPSSHLNPLFSLSVEILLVPEARLEAALLMERSNTSPHHVTETLNPETFLDTPDNEALPFAHFTYQRLGGTLIDHPRIPGMFLLKFITFNGLEAYQPCCKDIDLLNVFKPLRTMEGRVDPIFKAAREWSCIIQAFHGLPKDIR
ncbi:gtpase-activator protein for ras gtpase [Fusarium austroafricanum]|uniref:Gtpase-activator protein for ras gtpase n=1 Tax=Fusarium austroafricanum TaxID=2364996 RepID=A0A8H4KBZ7_9HYPO|nr:gtpase-activator protein for ras gtpase [Fusarium austroafricanum]